MLLQLKPREFTKRQMDEFVVSVKGKVERLNVFTLPDPEATGYGFQVIQGLQSAGVQVEWYPATAPYFLIPGVSSTGLTLWDDPRVNIRTAISDGFRKAEQSVSMFPDRPAGQDRPGVISPSTVPIPALFVALKQPAFAAIPEFLGKGTSHSIRLPQPHKPPWEP
jgi:hypothetical protein